jgi:hypothetical protein
MSKSRDDCLAADDIADEHSLDECDAQFANSAQFLLISSQKGRQMPVVTYPDAVVFVASNTQ